ncbi:flagellin [Sulfitobacter donghicola]|uniref:Flagellin n=1 Tax=Sulfitobacter donghicola DSW-25 = KCTC 12864 = JCM 14565 TaxID=1300350 RepID=A0A073ILY2_9RHOB|nr:flagellin [Sulfitobacter donghicola]KEJ90560.1 flagellin [Sulfitobacter donghicola DSW-25 = KCTC 12864 = JCM 14565]KIN67806.1 Flagellin domain protein [Sulfitobacter donghicola DSW-25 = KCTC 12864 = JCM 14565]
MSSILTNNSAMVALQTLKSINSNLSDTQNSISTGKDINTAKDNASVWAISKVMESDVAGFDAVQDSLSVGQSTVAVASTGAERIVETLTEMKELAVSAQSETADFGKIEADMASKRDQIDAIISGSQFNGVNLLKTDIDGTGGTSLTVVSSLDRVGSGAPTVSTIDVSSADFETSVDTSAMTAIADVTTAASAFGEIETMLTAAINGAAALGSDGKRVDDQMDYISKLSDTVTSGIGALVDTDMEAASAKLQALQTQQQLGVQALSIANESPSTIMSLFR